MTDTMTVTLNALASALLHALWQDTLLAGAAALSLRAAVRASAAWRHVVGMAFLVLMVLALAAQFFFCLRESAYLVAGGARMAHAWFGASAVFFGAEPSFAAAVAVSLWLLGVAGMLVRQVGAVRAVARMERGPYEMLPPRWRTRVDEFCRAMGIARSVAVRLSDEVLIPCTARLARPVIWLPLSLLTRMPAAQLEALLAHELAHIARKDWLWNGVQRAVECLLFFHPAVWWLGRRVRQEREQACDDLASATCGDSVVLAEALLVLERERSSAPRLVLAAGGGRLLQRVTRLLSGPSSRARWGRPAFLGALMVLGVFLTALVGMALGNRHDLLVRATTHGLVDPGDFREISDNRFDMRRFYRASIDPEGRLVEAYWVNGHRRPIDSEVRRWIEDPRPGLTGDRSEVR